MEEEKREKIEQALREVIKDNRLSCHDALDLAKRLDVESRLIGKVADALEAKICGCQLGCF
jgi:hypothetical protein